MEYPYALFPGVRYPGVSGIQCVPAVSWQVKIQKRNMNMSSGLLRTISLPAVALIVLAGGWIGYTAAASRPTVVVRDPTVVAVVRLDDLRGLLDQQANILIEMGALQAGVKQEREERLEELKRLEDQFTNEVDEAKKAAIQDEMNLAGLRNNAWSHMAQQRMDIEWSVRVEALYDSIRVAARQLAQIEGIDVIILDNSVEALNDGRLNAEAPRVLQAEQQLASIRLLYVRPDLDVTNQLAQRMNNAFRAGANP